MKMYVVATHAYASELNRALVRRNPEVWMACPGLSRIQDIRQRYFRAQPPVIMAVVSTHYPPEHKWLERYHAGTVADRKDALRFAREIKEKLAPGGTVKIRTYMKG